jgi:hypothetical protein
MMMVQYRGASVYTGEQFITVQPSTGKKVRDWGYQRALLSQKRLARWRPA